MNRNVKGWVLLLLIFVVIPFAALAYLWKDVCVTNQVSESLSPDGSFAVSILATDCKGRLKPATEVRVTFKNKGGSQTPEQVLLYQGTELPDLAWPSHGVLRVSYPKGAEIVTRKSNLSGLAIELGEKSL